MPEWVAGLIFAFIFFCIVGGLYLVKRRRRGEMDHGWEALARQFGLQYQARTEGGEAKGIVDGRQVTIETSYHRVNDAISRRTHWRVGLDAPLTFEIEIVPRSFGNRVVSALGISAQQLLTGDSQFDNTFIVRGSSKESLERVLEPRVREALTGMPDFDRVSISAQLVSAEVNGYETNEQRLGWMLRTLMMLATNCQGLKRHL